MQVRELLVSGFRHYLFHGLPSRTSVKVEGIEGTGGKEEVLGALCLAKRRQLSSTAGKLPKTKNAAAYANPEPEKPYKDSTCGN